MVRAAFPKNKLAEIASKFTEADFQKWVDDEGFPLAVKAGYLDGKLEGGTKKDNALELPEGYLKDGRAVAERRMAVAGYRLAEVLKAATK